MCLSGTRFCHRFVINTPIYTYIGVYTYILYVRSSSFLFLPNFSFSTNIRSTGGYISRWSNNITSLIQQLLFRPPTSMEVSHIPATCPPVQMLTGTVQPELSLLGFIKPLGS